MTLVKRITLICCAALLGAAFASRASFAVEMHPSQVAAARLYGEIGGCSVVQKPNFVFSPLSVLDVFHAAQKGAAGETRRQMDTIVGPEESFALPEFQQPQQNDNSVIVESANRLFASRDLEGNETFHRFKKSLGTDKYGAETVDFSDPNGAASHINGYVAQTTRGHIKEILLASSLNSLTKLVLVNALYFKAPWLSQFSEHATTEDTFFTPSGPKQVYFMRQRLGKAPLLHTMEDGVTCVGIPYADPQLRLYIFMPENLDEFEARAIANPEALESLVEKMEEDATKKALDTELHLTVPKFKLSAKANLVDLVPLFQRLGVTDMFSAEKADFSGISGGRDIYASVFVHQADIDVNEEGTEATAATAMVMMMRSMPIPKTGITVQINKPFMFQLRFVDRENSIILFSGRIADPSAAQ